MFNNLTDLTKQLTSKQAELQMLTAELSKFLKHQQNCTGSFKQKKTNKKIEELAEQVSFLKKSFNEIDKDIKTYGQYPFQILNMLATLPEMYDNIVEVLQIKWRKMLTAKDEHCIELEQIIEKQQNQIVELKEKLDRREQIKNYQLQKLFSDEFQRYKPENGNKQYQDDANELISSMEVTLRQYTESHSTENCHKITEIEEQEEQEEDIAKTGKRNHPPGNERSDSLFSFQNILQSLESQHKIKSTRNPMGNSGAPKRRKPLGQASITMVNSGGNNFDRFQPNILKHKNIHNSKPRSNSFQNAKNKNTSAPTTTRGNLKSQSFWNQLQNQIGHQNFSGNKQNQKKAFSKSKGKEEDKKEGSWKVGDYRKFLSLEQGIKRFGVGLS